jgi:hypothetical protein
MMKKNSKCSTYLDIAFYDVKGGNSSVSNTAREDTTYKEMELLDTQPMNEMDELTNTAEVEVFRAVKLNFLLGSNGH